MGAGVPEECRGGEHPGFGADAKGLAHGEGCVEGVRELGREAS